MMSSGLVFGKAKGNGLARRDKGLRRAGLALALLLAASGCAGQSESPTHSAAEVQSIAAPSRSAPASGAPTEAPPATPKLGGTFVQTGSMLTERDDCATSTLLADGRVLVAGGYGNGARVNYALAEIYDPVSGRWTITGSMASERCGHTATLLKDGRVLIAGGADGKTAELYDRATGKFSPTGATKVSIQYSTATLLPDGRVLLAGGSDGVKYFASAEIYDPATGKFSWTGSMKEAREQARAVLLANGRVLIMGGDQGTGPTGMHWLDLDSAEVYDPVAGRFTATGSMDSPRTAFNATLLASGKVLVSGGEDYSDQDRVDIYDPAAAMFTPIDSHGYTDYAGTWAALLADGRVLIGASPGLASVLYDPIGGTFTFTHSLPEGAKIPPVTLPDGRVLIPGTPSALYLP